MLDWLGVALPDCDCVCEGVGAHASFAARKGVRGLVAGGGGGAARSGGVFFATAQLGSGGSSGSATTEPAFTRAFDAAPHGLVSRAVVRLLHIVDAIFQR